jgi:hypothetical protein
LGCPTLCDQASNAWATEGADGNWPAEPVREALDLFSEQPMLEGLRVGKANRRGIKSRMPGDGGNLELILVPKAPKRLILSECLSARRRQ